METGRVVIVAPAPAPVTRIRALWLCTVVCLAAYIGCTFALVFQQEGENREP